MKNIEANNKNLEASSIKNFNPKSETHKTDKTKYLDVFEFYLFKLYFI
jgi:hypothetical protein